jgi:hypothetical protein
VLVVVVVAVAVGPLRHVWRVQEHARKEPGSRTHARTHMSDSICQNGDDTWPLLKDLAETREADILRRVGTKVAKELWDLHSVARWNGKGVSPTLKCEDVEAKETRESVLKALDEDELLHVRELGCDGDVAKYEAVAIGRMNCFFKALLRIGYAAAQLYTLWPSKRDTLPSAQCDLSPDAPPFDFPDVLEPTLELHVKGVVSRAVQKALKNKNEPLRNILEVPSLEDDDGEEESVDEGSSIGDGSDEDSDDDNNDEDGGDSTDASEEEDEEPEELPMKKKAKV